ncbi:hypothetical protein L1987_11240 [Smallanthus sonchifolius]|uniref:Uncharacterized protein n=1 Tax=Smallanthus sonchifolius TaxID=185202 RepID=A0ACB9JAC8_9ASTR|nr:hypothetical protein L1987_11240 [Smallanthus sonchifolius]
MFSSGVEMENGVNFNECFEMDYIIKVQESHGLKFVEQEENVHDDDYGLVDGVNKHGCLETAPIIHVVPKESVTKKLKCLIQEKVREIEKLTYDVECLIKEGTENHTRDDELNLRSVSMFSWEMD